MKYFKSQNGIFIHFKFPQRISFIKVVYLDFIAVHSLLTEFIVVFPGRNKEQHSRAQLLKTLKM